MRALLLIAALMLAAPAAAQPAPDLAPLARIFPGRGFEALPNDLRAVAEDAQALGVLIAWAERCDMAGETRAAAERLRTEYEVHAIGLAAPLRQYVAGIVDGARQAFGQVPTATACAILSREAAAAILRLR